MRPNLLPLALTAACLAGCAGRPDRGLAATAPPAQQPLTLSVESPEGPTFPSVFYLGSQYVAGQFGARYDLRLSNNTAERVEAVVTVDGRDVISGEPGNFRQQRGYVIAPFSSIVVEGFRQSLDQVAAFRFSELGDSYSARRGTAQNVGVIGVAVFREKPSREPKQAFAPRPAFEGGGEFANAEPFPDSRARSAGPAAGATADSSAPKKSSASRAPAAADEAPASAPLGGSAESEAQALAPSPAPGDDAFAPAPTPRNELGTQYGESTFSAVSQVEFKRRHKRKPDAFLTVYYDSPRGLQARGIPLEGAAVVASGSDPQAFPGSR